MVPLGYSCGEKTSINALLTILSTPSKSQRISPEFGQFESNLIRWQVKLGLPDKAMTFRLIILYKLSTNVGITNYQKVQGL